MMSVQPLRKVASFVSTSFAAALVILLVAGTVFTSVSCIKKIEEKDAPLGVESSPADVQKVVDAATAGITIATGKISQSVTYEENYRVEIGPVIMSKRYSHRLLDIKEDATTVLFALFEDLWTFFPSGAIRDEAHRELDLKFNKSSAPTTGGAPTLALSAAQIGMKLASGFNDFIHPSAVTDTCTSQTLDDGDGIKYNCIRYFNVHSEHRLVDVPAAMQNKSNCGGAPSCQFGGTYIEYDQVKFLQDKMVRRVNLSAHFSKDIPDFNYLRGGDGKYSYTPAVSSFCTMGLEQVENQKYLVTLCSVLRDAQL